ncbi:PHB depolymerase family esterase [Azospirillum sp. RWY-5-1]|uniref:PHB depolymerase family esterase n=1 Tax=Azospirillum oleiclasticum TaxID=2735135 RepID=A0ABX2TB84_9PROT|nr:PHB depolymerase family esterase [Azospirillum oleiclasticum]NYZ13277.1 PHB depolymerase family esterase [Azospirillum oleiclasticum]NYZ20438.1 PHB depolymerase family esterase [Azospirillum oleiclasticum]
MRAVVVGLCAAFAATWSGGAAAQSLTAVPDFGRAWGENPGNLLMHEYVPPDAAGAVPVVVVLHGCKQNARLYAEGSGWLALAAAGKFALVAPEQKAVNNSSLCFNWFYSGDNGILPGEQTSIANMVEHLGRRVPIDRKRLYVTGLSAGGGMAAVMLAVYPNWFAGGSLVAGVPYRCAAGATSLFPGGDVTNAFACMQGRVNRKPQDWGKLVRDIAAQRLRHSYDGPWPTVAIWHGTTDPTVAPTVSGELTEQWTNVHGVPAKPVRVEPVPAGTVPLTRETYAGTDGRAVVVRYLLEGFPHATPIDPAPSAARCGTPSEHIRDADLCAALVTAKDWGLVP